ncbi:MAG TPA: hypothetical protein VFT29_19200 [Gemmatimonadaceae bacterium]|nr:hypothetical protein [Gemmatimonadaceae bacterium]
MKRTASRTLLLLIVLGCRYAGPFAGGASEIREGSFSNRVARILRDDGGARPDSVLLPAGARDSAAIYLFAATVDGTGVRNAEVVVQPISLLAGKEQQWQTVDRYGVFVARYPPGEYTVHVRSPFHWEARKVVRLGAGAVDTLLAIMRNGAEYGRPTYRGFPPFED